MAYHLTIAEDGTCTVHGIDYDNGSKPIKLVATGNRYDADRTIIVMRVPSGSHWVGNYMPRAYHPTSCVAWEVVQRIRVDTFKCVELFHFDLGRSPNFIKRPHRLNEMEPLEKA